LGLDVFPGSPYSILDHHLAEGTFKELTVHMAKNEGFFSHESVHAADKLSAPSGLRAIIAVDQQLPFHESAALVCCTRNLTSQ
jgi:hypothetical protein